MNAKERKEMTRILSGEASTEEKERFYEGLEADPEKKRTYEGLEKEWITASDAMLYKSLDVEAAWERHQKEYLRGDESAAKSLWGVVWKWAAVIAIVAGTAFYFLSERIHPVQEFTYYSTGSGEYLPVKLADGSTVTLNEHSTLACTFNGQKRMVDFTGEAFFEVAPDAGRPFIIEMDNAYVRVVGTAFNVKAAGRSVKVVVQDGLVEFGSADRSEKTLLKKGYSGILSGKQLSTSDSPDPNALSWYTKKLVFSQTPLTEVLFDITRTYYVSFQYDSSQFSNCRLTADFNHEELPHVLETLRTIFSVDFVKDDNIYVVTGQACK